jgi:hypothetical protein
MNEEACWKFAVGSAYKTGVRLDWVLNGFIANKPGITVAAALFEVVAKDSKAGRGLRACSFFG